MATPGAKSHAALVPRCCCCCQSLPNSAKLRVPQRGAQMPQRQIQPLRRLRCRRLPLVQTCVAVPMGPQSRCPSLARPLSWQPELETRSHCHVMACWERCVPPAVRVAAAVLQHFPAAPSACSTALHACAAHPPTLRPGHQPPLLLSLPLPQLAPMHREGGQQCVWLSCRCL